MSIAAALARLPGAAARAAPPTLVHDDPRAAAREPRAEVAGAACNALEQLSTYDKVLTSLVKPLLLHNVTADRSVVEPKVDRRVSNAVVLCALRLAPAFATRTAHRALEWLVRGLEVGRLGKDAEVDALLVAALPFHSTLAFARLVHALLSPKHAAGAVRRKWAWLAPVANERKPASFDFIVAHASCDALRAAVEYTMASAAGGIPTSHLSSFIASVLASRLASGGKRLERRTLALACLEAIDAKDERYQVVCGPRKDGSHSSAAFTEINHVRVALLLALATGVAANAFDDEMREAVLHAAVRTMTAPKCDFAARDTAAGCAVVCVSAAGYHMPRRMAKRLAKWGDFAEVIRALKDTPGTDRVLDAYNAALVRKPSTKRRKKPSGRASKRAKRE